MSSWPAVAKHPPLYSDALNWVQDSRLLSTRLIKEIKHLLLLRKVNLATLASYVASRPATYISMQDLVHSSPSVRRLAVVLIGLVFEQNPEILRTTEVLVSKLVSFTTRALFLCKASPAIRNSRPEPLYHVERPLLQYLPRHSYPDGQVCYLDFEKLESIVRSTEYIRLPDPLDHVIWLSIESDPLATSIGGSLMSESSSSEEFNYLRNFSNSPDKVKKPVRTAIRILAQFASIQGKRARKAELREQQMKNKQRISESSIKPANGVHRIKCFQFFRKQKEQAEPFAGTNLVGQAHPVGELQQRAISPPQFESVNDWATDKDNSSHYSTQIKFISLSSMGKERKLKSNLSPIPEPNVPTKSATTDSHNERHSEREIVKLSTTKKSMNAAMQGKIRLSHIQNASEPHSPSSEVKSAKWSSEKKPFRINKNLEPLGNSTILNLRRIDQVQDSLSFSSEIKGRAQPTSRTKSPSKLVVVAVPTKRSTSTQNKPARVLK